jgi:hypothetical protein
MPHLPSPAGARYAAATAFALCNAANAFLWICFAPVADATARRFRVSVGSVNQLSLLFLYLYAPGYLLSVYVTQRYGLRANVGMGALLNAACAWVRLLRCDGALDRLRPPRRRPGAHVRRVRRHFRAQVRRSAQERAAAGGSRRRRA